MLNQYELIAYFQDADNRKLTKDELDQIKDVICFDLQYALKGRLLYDLTIKKVTK